MLLYCVYKLYNNQKCKYIDDRKLCINNESNSDKYTILKKISDDLIKLKDYMDKNHAEHDITKTLNINFKKNLIITEIFNSKHVAFSKNKGQEISFCLSDKKINMNTLMFVALHEFTHIATNEIGHTYLFWDNYKFILQCAVKINIYKPEDYKTYPVKFCNLTINNNPLY